MNIAPHDRGEAVARALAAKNNVPNTCQLWTRLVFGAPSAGDFDHDGASDAEDGWKSEPAAYKHPGDRNPPAGVPVSYGGGSSDNGHRAVSLGRTRRLRNPIRGVTMIRSTDADGPGHIATVPLDWPEKTWGLTYLGWSDTCDGWLIPTPKPKPPKTSNLSHIHASGRFDATVEQVTAAWDKFRSTRGVQIITGTEHGSGEHDAAFEADGWDYVRLGECVVSWDATELEPAWKPSLTLIGTPYFRGGNENSRTKLLSVPLRHLASGRVFMVRVAHTPAHVQAGNGFRKTTARVIRQAAGWSTGLVAWGRKSRRFRRSHPNAAEVSVADWNVDLHRHHWRALIRKSLRLTCAHGRHLPERGDLGKRLVSWFFLRGVEVGATAVLNAVDGYDHRPVIAHLSIKHKEQLSGR